MLAIYGARRYTIHMKSLTNKAKFSAMQFFESLTNDGIYEDIAVSICSTDFAHTHNVTLKEAQTLVGCALHMTKGVIA